jgi:hypothetical protein
MKHIELFEQFVNEAMPFDKEKLKVKQALDRWVEYSIENGDSNADVLSVGEEYIKDSISAYDKYLRLKKLGKIK